MSLDDIRCGYILFAPEVLKHAVAETLALCDLTSIKPEDVEFFGLEEVEALHQCADINEGHQRRLACHDRIFETVNRLSHRTGARVFHAIVIARNSDDAETYARHMSQRGIFTYTHAYAFDDSDAEGNATIIPVREGRPFDGTIERAMII